jgi:hypothetical protein
MIKDVIMREIDIMATGGRVMQTGPNVQIASHASEKVTPSAAA